MPKSILSLTPCNSYDLDLVQQSISSVLTPLGSIHRFVKPGMRVLLKPNLLSVVDPSQCVTTHPAVLQAVGELVRDAGAEVWIGDSPASEKREGRDAWQASGMAEVISSLGAKHVSFHSAVLKELNGHKYYIARPVLDADLIINLPKLKTHSLTLYTGCVKNLFGSISGGRKQELHVLAPGVRDFSAILVDILQLVKPALNIMDGVMGLEGNGPGVAGTPHAYNLLAASTDAVALDTIMARAMGFPPKAITHLEMAGSRGLGISDPDEIEIFGDPSLLDFGSLDLPRSPWYARVPSWISAPLQPLIRVKPRLEPSLCTGCGTCVRACASKVITPGKPVSFDLSHCIGCMCCVEVCPESALTPRPSPLAKFLGLGR